MTVKQFLSKVDKINAKSRGSIVLGPPLGKGELDAWAAKHPNLILPKDLLAFLKQHNGLCVRPNENSEHGVFRLLSLGMLMDRQGVLDEGITFVIEDLPEGGLVISQDSDGESSLILVPATGEYLFLDAGECQSVGQNLAEMLDWLHGRFVAERDPSAQTVFFRVDPENQKAEYMLGSAGEPGVTQMFKVSGDCFYSAEWGHRVIDGRYISQVTIARHGQPMYLDVHFIVALGQPNTDGPVDTPIVDFALLPNRVVFLMEDKQNRCLLWRADLPADRGGRVPQYLSYDVTSEVKVFDEVPARGKRHWMTVVGGQSYFVIYAPSGDKQLWVTDGSAEGTRMLRTWKRHGPAFLLEHKGALIFSAGLEPTPEEKKMI